MREVKFRAQSRFGRHKWIYGSLLQLNGKCYICPEESDTWNMKSYEVIPHTIGQYTGLKDKNGVDIYEGDRLLLCDDETFTIINVVGHKAGCFGYIGETNGKLLPFCDYEVTEEICGNIHDNIEKQ